MSSKKKLFKIRYAYATCQSQEIVSAKNKHHALKKFKNMDHAYTMILSIEEYITVKERRKGETETL